MSQIASFLTQCDQLQAQELAIIIEDARQASASATRRRRLAVSVRPNRQ
jgi:hypothetical protein